METPHSPVSRAEGLSGRGSVLARHRKRSDIFHKGRHRTPQPTHIRVLPDVTLKDPGRFRRPGLRATRQLTRTSPGAFPSHDVGFRTPRGPEQTCIRALWSFHPKVGFLTGTGTQRCRVASPGPVGPWLALFCLRFPYEHRTDDGPSQQLSLLLAARRVCGLRKLLPRLFHTIGCKSRFSLPGTRGIGLGNLNAGLDVHLLNSVLLACQGVSGTGGWERIPRATASGGGSQRIAFLPCDPEV